MSYQYPRTADEWWSNVHSHWGDILGIVNMFTSGRWSIPDLVRMKDNKDNKLARVFAVTWAGAPDHRSIHSIPGWGVLCDLCSEDYVLYEDQQSQEDS